jgi:hypothetical protein
VFRRHSRVALGNPNQAHTAHSLPKRGPQRVLLAVPASELSPPRRLQERRLLRGGAIRALQAPGLEAPTPARGHDGTQLQARPKVARAEPREQNAYRRWLARERGWQAIQAPGRPLCNRVKLNPPGRSKPCQRHALADSEYCYSHDPWRALERQATTARMRARARQEPGQALEQVA